MDIFRLIIVEFYIKRNNKTNMTKILRLSEFSFILSIGKLKALTVLIKQRGVRENEN